MKDVIVYTNVHLQLWQEAYRDGMVTKDGFDRAWNMWSLLAQRALWAVGYDAELRIKPDTACEVYERSDIGWMIPLSLYECDRVEKVLHSIGLEV